jgi:D-hexose-6-phosphate mutarotase
VEGSGAVSNQLPDRLLVVPERGGLITGWRCNGVEWLYLDEQRFADSSKSVRGGIARWSWPLVPAPPCNAATG